MSQKKMTGLSSIELSRVKIPYGPEFNRAFSSALKRDGALILKGSEIAGRALAMLSCLKELFNLSREKKESYRLDRAAGLYTGYSFLETERDFREQFHLFMNFDSTASTSALKEPNQAPSGLSSVWVEAVADHMNFMQELGQNLLSLLVENPLTEGTGDSSSSYSLLKMIRYHSSGAEEKIGTPPHLDWSLLTLVVQDSRPGLMVLDESGSWKDVVVEAGSIIVLVGELLELASAGKYLAAPHKVVIPGNLEERMSAPFFLSPSLDQWVNCPGTDYQRRSGPEHIHRVFDRGELSGPLQFGASEYNRKVGGRWCYRRECSL